MEALHYRVSHFRLPREHSLASVSVLLRDLCPPSNLEVSDILSPKEICRYGSWVTFSSA